MTATAAVSEWVDPAAPTAVRGAEPAGVYLGTADTPEVIDPSLPIEPGAPDWHGTSVERPPHFAELTPQARAAFLVWHRTGRCAPQAPAVWALLHLYGLERRILLDGDGSPDLRTEARALGELYGSDPEVARVATALAGVHPRSDPPELTDAAAPDELQIELGRRALASDPIDAAWALAWAWFHPDLPHREAARRVPDEFARLWSHHFEERHPDGLVVRPKRRRLTLDYAPANPSLPTPLELTVLDASDVFLTAGPMEALREISDQVETDLAPYVRWRSRHADDNPTSVRAAAVLPRPLLAGSEAECAARPLVDVAESVLGDGPMAVAECGPILRVWADATNQESIDRRDAVEIAQVLERFGVGIEPDVRFGGRPINRRSPAVFFRQADNPATSPSDGYAAALVTLELCAAVAVADGVVDDAEQAMLVAQIDRVEGLTGSERARLDAHRVLVASSGLDLDDVASRTVRLPRAERRSLASYLLDLARVDGVVTDDEVRVLRAVHELLDLDPGEVERRLRPRVVPLSPRMPADSPGELFTLQPAEDGASDGDPALLAFAPAPELVEPTVPDEDAEPVDDAAPSTVVVVDKATGATAPPVRVVQVDEERLSARQADNEMVRNLLTAIFDDDDDEDEDDREDDEAQEPPQAVLATLDAAHSALLRELADRGRTSRQDLERISARLGVLPDGALDVINEAALDLTEDPVVEVHDDESVTVDSDTYEEMCA